MTWLYLLVAGAAVARWSLWYLRNVVEWMEAPRRDYVSAAMLLRLRVQRDQEMRSPTRMPVLQLSEEAVGGPRGA